MGNGIRRRKDGAGQACQIFPKTTPLPSIIARIAKAALHKSLPSIFQPSKGGLHYIRPVCWLVGWQQQLLKTTTTATSTSTTTTMIIQMDQPLANDHPGTDLLQMIRIQIRELQCLLALVLV